MFLPAIQYIHLHALIPSNIFKSLIKCRPLNPITRRDFRGKLNYITANQKTLVKRLYSKKSLSRPAITFKKGYTTLYKMEDISLRTKYVSALKYKDSCSLNGGYIPSHDELLVTNKMKFVPVLNWQWYAQSKEGPSGGSVRGSGGGLGRLDSANEDGFFYKLNRSRLKKLKQLLKEKGELKSKEENPDNKKTK